MVVALNGVHMAVVLAGKMVQTIYIQKKNPGFHHFSDDDLLSAPVIFYTIKGILKFKTRQLQKISMCSIHTERLLVLFCICCSVLFLYML